MRKSERQQSEQNERQKKGGKERQEQIEVLVKKERKEGNKIFEVPALVPIF